MTQTRPFLEINKAVVRRAGKVILHVEHFVLQEGESLALLGPNGAGKSTFAGLITRDVMPLHNEQPPVLFRGNARSTLDEVKRSVGYVSSSMQQQIRVHLSSLEVVEGGLFGSLGVPKRFEVSPAQAAQALAIMDSLGIADLAQRDVMTLSSGQARRVLIARALVHEPSALIFDEPCTGLDPEGMYSVRKTMRDVARSGRAVILITHYLEDIIPEIDRIALIKDAHIIADGPKSQILTTENISRLFEAPLRVRFNHGYYSLETEY